MSSIILAALILATPSFASVASLLTDGQKEGRCVDEASCASPDEQQHKCSLYLAPSTIPDAGLGIYTTEHVSSGSIVGESDELFIPILDTYKTLPYRGQQRFLPWLGYVWPEHPDAFYHTTKQTFPQIPDRYSSFRLDEGLNAARSLRFHNGEKFVNAFAPGMASQANSQPKELANLKKNSKLEKKDAAAAAGDDPGVGAFTPHHGVSFSAVTDIPAGSELFLSYGSQWHKRFDSKKEGTEYCKGGFCEEGSLYMEGSDSVEEENNNSKQEDNKEDEGDADAVKQPDSATSENGTKICSDQAPCEADNNISSLEEQKEVISTQQKQKEAVVEREEEEVDSIRQVDWLEQNGVCIDKIRVGNSTIPHAGRGAFAKTHIPQGSLIAPAPLVALKRDDLVIYETDERQETYRDTLNLDKVKGHELLLNYCYGHVDSPLLLLPYSTVVNFINHAHGEEEPNAKIRWPQEEGEELSKWSYSPKEWLDLHPLDVMDMSGRLMMEFVALRDIQPGEEILVDYGEEWEDAWKKHVDTQGSTETEEGFRHEIGVPDGFFPDAWLHQSAVYELAPLDSPLQPGEVVQMTWAHNGKPIHPNAWRVGLPPGFSAKLRDYSDDRGITSTYEKLLYNDVLESDDWYKFDAHGGNETWFAQRYMNTDWDFNMHYVAAWDEAARVSFLRALGKGGFDVALDAMGTKMGLDNITCFHVSWMGVSECDNSFTHTDIYSTGEKAFNFVFPAFTVNGSKPELDVQSDDANIVVAVHYEEDVTIAMGDGVYHKTSAIDYSETGQKRVVVGTYCGQIDQSTAEKIAYIYSGEDPAPFFDQFEQPFKEIHWGDGHTLPK